MSTTAEAGETEAFSDLEIRSGYLPWPGSWVVVDCVGCKCTMLANHMKWQPGIEPPLGTPFAHSRRRHGWACKACVEGKRSQ
jgi:hypothetical protein